MADVYAPNAESAEFARAAAETYVQLADPMDPEELTDESVYAGVLRSLIADLCHLADSVGIVGDREELVLKGYGDYRTEVAYEAYDPAA